MNSGRLLARVSGIGVIAPGIPDWNTGIQMLRGSCPWVSAPLLIPATEFIPPAERRRAGKAVRLALGCGYQAMENSGQRVDAAASVFASTDGDAENTHQICMALTEAEPALSPTRFHNSVQNAVSGYWSIVTGSRAPTTMVMGGDEILALGLLEAVTQAAAPAVADAAAPTAPTIDATRPVLLVVFDVPMPAPLFATHPVEEGGAIALVLDSQMGTGPTIRARLLPRSEGHPPDAVPEGLGALRRMHPVGAALPLLLLLAGGGPDRGGGQVHLDFDRYHVMQLTVEH